MNRRRVRVGDRTLLLSNLDKVLYPATGTTKAEVIAYYQRVADAILPELEGRPLMMVRYPDGVGAEGFVQQRCPDHAPDWMGTVELPGEDGPVRHCTIDDLPSLVWAANLAALELHVTLGRRPDPTRATAVMFDLDPGPGAGLAAAAGVALALRELLTDLGLEAAAKVSGRAGVHVVVPLDPPEDFDRTRRFAHAIAELLARRDPTVVTSRTADRRGRVLIDWLQNRTTATTIAAYSLRATERPRVSAPVTWQELEADPDALRFGPDEVVARLQAHGDLWATTRSAGRPLPEVADGR